MIIRAHISAAATALAALLVASAPSGADDTKAPPEASATAAASRAQPRPVIGADRLLVGELLPTGSRITPTAAAGSVFRSLNPNLPQLPDFTAGQAVEIALSPDGGTMLVLTSGYNRNYGGDGKAVPELSNEYVFVYDVAGREPVKRQVIQVPNAYVGIVWRADGKGFYVSGGVDDVVHLFRLEETRFVADGAPIALGHGSGNGIRVKPMVAGLALSPDGKRLMTANLQNDSVSIIDLQARRAVAEFDLRPGRSDPARAGVAGGEFPFGVAWASDGRAFVGSERDREIVVLAIDGDRLRVKKRIKLAGQPGKMILTRDRSRLFVVADNSDTVVALDANDGDITAEFSITAPGSVFLNPAGLHGANPNNLTLSPDERTLFVTNGGLNAVAVVQIGKDVFADDDNPAGKPDDEDGGLPATSRVIGLIPTGWYPNAVAVGRGGRTLFVVNGKSNAGPNPAGCRDDTAPFATGSNACRAANEYVWQLSKAGLATIPMPRPVELAGLTLQVASNNNFPIMAERRRHDEVMDFLRSRVRHVVYIVKENRTYDQVLGDLAVGNGDPTLVLFPRPITPNHHALAENFVTLDHFLDSGESSNTGWLWSTAARTTDYTEKAAPVNYADRGLQYDQEGNNRNVNVGIAAQPERRAANPATPNDPDLLPGTGDVAAPDPAAASGGEAGTGYLWDAALRAGRTIRNYGFFGDLSRYFVKDDTLIPLTRDPFAERRQVFFPTKPALAPHTDIYYRGFDMAFSDFYLVSEWQREFSAQVAARAMPNLTLLRLPHDHFGQFGQAIDGVNTPELQIADNDYAIGRVVETIAASPFAADTLVFIVEDDAQNGADHVDAHRSMAFVVGPYVRRGAVVSKPYTTVNLLRTLEEILGLAPLGLNDGLAEPMTDFFDPAQPSWSYQAEIPPILRRTALPLPPEPLKKAEAGCFGAPTHDAAYWDRVMAGQNFHEEDRLDVAAFNSALWHGLIATASEPRVRSNTELGHDRAALLAAWRMSGGCAR
jgi:DNA-binding beta-propeller fold protein YncE